MNPMEDLKKKSKNKNLLRTIALYVILALAATFVILSLFEPKTGAEEKNLSEFLTLIKEERVKEVTVEKNQVVAILEEDDKQIKTIKEESSSFVETLKDAGIDPKSVPLKVKDNSTSEALLGLAAAFLPVLIIVGFFIFFLRQARMQGDSIMSFARSRAKLFNKDKPTTRFGDVAGVDEAKQELKEVVEFLKSPEKFRSLGAKIPKGVLLVGPSGVGKTLMARAVAGEAEVPFFSIAGSEFMEMLVGVGASRVRDLFLMAKESQPSMIFIDEIDAIGRQRGMGIGGGHDEREQTLNQILIEMDGFDVRTDVIVVAATNSPDMLDPALIRAGRFDRKINIPLPDLKDREEIIKIHMRGKPFSTEVDI